MSKKINAYIDVKTNRIVILSDNVDKDDYIDLNSLSSINDYVETSIENNYNLKEKLFNQFKTTNEYLELKKQAEQLAISTFEINSLKEKIKNNEEDIINKFKASDEYNNLRLENQQLHQNINFLKEEIKNIKINAVNEFKASNEHQSLLTNLATLQSNYEYLKNDIPNIQNKAILEYKKSYEYQQLENQLENYKKQVDLRNSLNIKQIGEDLENYCLNNYNETMGQYVNDCKFEKATIPINGNKPDFVFEVYGRDSENNVQFINDYLLGKVVLEMKSELLNSNDKNKKTNQFHLLKLEKDRINFGADFGILVTELESDKDFVIQKPSDFQNIIIIRPQALPSLLNILRNLYLKKNELILEQINFKSSKEILDDFHEFKQSILENALQQIQNKVNEINKNAESIKKNAEKILDLTSLVLFTYVDRIINKINNFKIENKIIKKINNLSTNKLDNKLLTKTEILDEKDIINEKIKL